MATKKEPGGRGQRRAGDDGREFPTADQYQDEDELEEAGSASPQVAEWRVGPVGPIGPVKAAQPVSSTLDDPGGTGQQEEELDEAGSATMPETERDGAVEMRKIPQSDLETALRSIDGIEGESSDDKHKSEIDVEFGAGAGSRATEAIGRNGFFDDTDPPADALTTDQGTIVDSGTIAETGTIVDSGTIVEQGTIVEDTAIPSGKVPPVTDLDDEALDVDM